MKEFAGFPLEAIVAIVAVSIAYFILSWAPLLWPLIATHRNRKEFPHRWLFIATIASLAYGIVVALLCIVSIPLSVYQVFIAPQLQEVGFHLSDPLLKANELFLTWWWILLPPTVLYCTLYSTRKLKPAWPDVCQALTANNSFKPRPLRGSA